MWTCLQCVGSWYGVILFRQAVQLAEYTTAAIVVSYSGQSL
ncbi:hypothetical protein SynA1528_01746 [Synechococcus sp. A15-28]|nr:hypothetical protein SynA1528_01746 [Synechococcus sp. A15-28]